MSSDDERDEKELDLTSPEVVTKYKSAAEIVNKALQVVLSECKPKAKIVDICEKGDAFIKEQTGSMYKSAKKKIDRGVAFPTCVSVNNTVGHFSPLASDETLLEEGDMLKIDMGCHIDGFIALVAHTHVLQDGPVTGRKADVIAAANTAAEVALRLVRPGKKNHAVTEAIQKVAEAYDCKIVEGVISHQMKQNVIDGSKCFLSVSTPETRVDDAEFLENEVYAIDIVASTGDGKPKLLDEKQTTVYKKDADVNYQLKMKASRFIFSEIKENFPHMPFTARSLEEKRARLGLVECVNHGHLLPYPVLYEKPGDFVAQIKFTVLLMPNGSDRITSHSLQELQPTKTVDDPEIKGWLALAIKKKKGGGKKKKAKKAGEKGETSTEAEPRFLWNNYMLEVLIDNKLDQFLLPVIQGSFNSFETAIGKDIVDITLIARRCTRRNGTRMWRRGADLDGYVANFVETEQIVQMNGYSSSFVQVRGSMPFMWEQIVDLTYKPEFEIVQPEEATHIAERHFLDLRKKYGSVLAVDLVNKHGGEGRLSEKFASIMQHITGDEIRYLHFDFHRICGHIHFERLSILYEQIEGFLEQNGYFLVNEKGDKMKEQLGVVRTNCIDCLDRTNVTQSMIGRKMLELQLKRIGVFGAEETISLHLNFDERYKILWANHGDEVSIQYSGTPALKGDFVRYGHRTTQGVLKDGWSSLVRYYLNNFADGTKQDAIDLLQGHYIVAMSRDMAPVPQKGGLEAVANFPAALAVVLISFWFATMSLKQAGSDYKHKHLFFSLLWTGICVGVAALVRANGRIFCNRPRLHKPRG